MGAAECAVGGVQPCGASEMHSRGLPAADIPGPGTYRYQGHRKTNPKVMEVHDKGFGGLSEISATVYPWPIPLDPAPIGREGRRKTNPKVMEVQGKGWKSWIRVKVIFQIKSFRPPRG